MAHFAQLDKDNKVINIVVVNNEELIDDKNNESEAKGIAFCKTLFGSDTIWIQTSYNNSIRKCHAQIGGFYDRTLNVFIPLKPYDSWKFNYENHAWESPIAVPEKIEGYVWLWFETNKEWVKALAPTK
jgi:hypothetical protein